MLSMQFIMHDWEKYNIVSPFSSGISPIKDVLSFSDPAVVTVFGSSSSGIQLLVDPEDFEAIENLRRDDDPNTITTVRSE